MKDEDIIPLTDIEDLNVNNGRLFLSGINDSSLAIILLLGFLGGLGLAGLAALAYLLYTKEDSGGDIHYYYGHNGGYDKVGHISNNGQFYDYYDDYEHNKGRNRRNTEANEQLACKLESSSRQFCNVSNNIMYIIGLLSFRDKRNIYFLYLRYHIFISI